MSEISCFECNDTGLVAQGDKFVQCNCVIKKKLKEFLGEYTQYKVNKSVARDYKKYLVNLFVENKDENLFGSMIKSVLASSYLENQSITYRSIHGIDLIDGLFVTDEYGNKINTEYYDTDILILKLGHDILNKILPDLLLNLLTYRKEHQKVTIIYVYMDTARNKLEKYYGADVLSEIKKYKVLK